MSIWGAIRWRLAPRRSLRMATTGSTPVFCRTDPASAASTIRRGESSARFARPRRSIDPIGWRASTARCGGPDERNAARLFALHPRSLHGRRAARPAEPAQYRNDSRRRSRVRRSELLRLVDCNPQSRPVGGGWSAVHTVLLRQPGLLAIPRRASDRPLL